MMDPTQLIRFWQFESINTEVASALVSNVLSPVQFLSIEGDGNFEIAIQIAQIDDVYVWHSTSSTGLSLRKEVVRNSVFELHFVEAGHCSTVTDNLDIETNPGDALLLKDAGEYDIVCQPHTAQLSVAMPMARYCTVMASEFGDPFADLSGMLPIAKFYNVNICSMKQIADLLFSLGRSAQAEEKSSAAVLLLCNGLLTYFAESWPRSTAHPPPYSARPFYIKRAMDWMQSHASEKITLEQLSTVSGVSGRTLQLGFQDFLGISPMTFLLKVRLKNAYRDLVAEPPAVTIDEIARRWRFSNPGKFAADIRANYGEKPLVIRRRPKTT